MNCPEHATCEPDCPACCKVDIAPGIYKHFKGGLYEVKEDFLVFDVNGEEAIPSIQYAKFGGSGPRFLRSVENFAGLIERENYSGPRFFLDKDISKLYLGKGRFTIVDRQDVLHLSLLGNWGIGGKGYVYGKIGSSRNGVLIHRIIAARMGLDTSREIDHRNRNRLDNRRSNLRSATDSQNNMNASLRSDNASGIKGVCWVTKAKKWSAYISADGRDISLGYFESFEDAKRERLLAEERYHGDFAAKEET